MNSLIKRVISKLILSTILFILLSCSSKNYYRLEYIESYYSKGGPSFLKNIQTDNIAFLVSDTGVVLFYLNTYKSEHYLIRCNITNGQTISSFKLKDNINFNFENNYYPVINSMDSIFFISNSKLLTINKDGSLLDCIKISDSTDNNKDIYMISSNFAAPSIVCNNKLISFKDYLQFQINNNDPFEVYRKKTNSTFTIRNGSIKHLFDFGNFPSQYQNAFYYDIYPSICCNNKGDVILSFSINDTIFVYNNSTLIGQHSIKSKIKTNIDSFPMEKFSDREYISKYIKSQFRYQSIIFDKYNSLYYRIVKQHVDDNSSEKGNIPWSIIIFDSNFKVQAEIDMDSDKYSYGSIIPTPSGLLISQKTKNNNQFSYALFKITNI